MRLPSPAIAADAHQFLNGGVVIQASLVLSGKRQRREYDTNLRVRRTTNEFSKVEQN